jgi:hypothetical protein
MAKKLLVLLAVVAIMAIALIPVVTTAQPVPPCRIHGTATVDGVLVVDGTVITATVDGDTYTSAPTPSVYGASTYLLQIAQPEGKSYVGKAITFKIGANDATESTTWVQGGNITLDLHKGVPVVTPPPGTGLTGVTVTGLPAGSTPSATISAAGILQLGIPAGAKGDTGAAGPAGATGATGPAGAQGEKGKDASNAMGIVALIIAIVALVVVIAAILLKRKATA